MAEQTRISSQYLESIENDEYGILPGGIFNKGFVKSFAKFVGVNEQEALEDYSRLIASNSAVADEPKGYRPEVLTDDGARGSMMPTLIVAGIILALMTIGILYGLSYLRDPTASDMAANASRTNTNLSNDTLVERAPDPASNTPEMANLKVEFKAVGAAVSLAATSDGKYTTSLVNAGRAATFEPKVALKLKYSRSLASAVQLVINGKDIRLPAVPLDPKRAAIEFEINKDNLAQIWNAGAISA
ncbi:MAG TPA: helix-turn-helix domain-containing protein, partial [Pyrinomonadaceae bacterium]|nr:helix-turn-helix domain-containing protein [Pyrinomonadaceae bacterium]